MTTWIDAVCRHAAYAIQCLALAVTVWGVPLAVAARRSAAVLLLASVGGVLTLEYLSAIGARTPSRRTTAWLLGVCASLFLIGTVAWIVWEQQAAPVSAGGAYVSVTFATAGVAYVTWLVQTHRAFVASVLVHAEHGEDRDDEESWRRLRRPRPADTSRRIEEAPVVQSPRTRENR